jgi:transposase
MWPDLKKAKIHVRPGKTDMRKQIDGLAMLVEQGMGKGPFTGDLFLFCGRDMTMVKALYWDLNGFCLWTKRLERGSFPWPRDEMKSVEWSAEELTMLLDGIDFRRRFTALKYQRFA